MKVYFYVFLVTLLIQLFPVKSQKGYCIRSLVTFLPLFLFGALRVDFGLDYQGYLDEYNLIHSYTDFESVSEHTEIGYIILNRIIPSWRLLLIITSALTSFAYARIFYKCIPTRYTWLAICLLFLAGDKTIFFMFSGIRNAIAISLMILFFELISKRKYILFLLITLLSTLFHTSAIVALPLAYLLAFNKKMTDKEGYVWISIMILLQVIPFESITNQVSQLTNSYLDRYSSYASTAEELGDTRTVLIRFVTAILTMGFVKFMKSTELNENDNSLCRLALLYSMAGLLGALNFRFNQYYCTFFILGCVTLISKWKIKKLNFRK